MIRTLAQSTSFRKALVAAAPLCLLGIIGWAPSVWATQGHDAPEGLYVHQLAHLFFLISMGILIYWLRKRDLVREVGWRFIQYAALFFIFWNLDAMAVHHLAELTTVLQIRPVGAWHMQITASPGLDWLPMVYFLTKLDHLICVPAMLFLYLGLKRILRDTAGGGSRAGRP